MYPRAPSYRRRWCKCPARPPSPPTGSAGRSRCLSHRGRSCLLSRYPCQSRPKPRRPSPGLHRRQRHSCLSPCRSHPPCPSARQR